ncbi:DNA polymerase III subunit delta [Paenarthrobacter sp. Z7-10]|uniref:DNA polymerase III subunit delta n=1 Tax=Paenarthrobacter sp. Z7-10 TaxID=2787635 RepID=UPI0022A9E980|nr:DNA polymerase III subunit delta [Paenarthrobacter sp. Z7-10]MCZ2402696.1 DNA polymerase III subunit delta [Paenarthrobacter sp. Z7-10]
MTPAASSNARPGAGAGNANVRTSNWRDVQPASLVLVQGTEEYLAARALAGLRKTLRLQSPDLEVTRLDASHYVAGQLAMAASPSLFGEAKLIEVSGLASMSDDFLVDGLDYVRAPDPDVVAVFHHGGGVRGKKLLDALKTGGSTYVECQPLKKDADKADFVAAEFRQAGRRIDPMAVRTLVAAVGASLAELAAACSQLIADVPAAGGSATVTHELVDKYYGGRVEATAFKVADAALAGNGPVALSSLRHALATGVDPVPLVAALAMKVRTLAKVYSARGSSAQIAKELGLQGWQVDQAKRDIRGWDSAALVRAIQVLAEADAQVKGAARDPIYAVERAVTVIATSRR